MSCARAIAAVLAVMMFAGCAAVAPGKHGPVAASFDMLGRVLVSGDGRAFSSGLRWRHDAVSDELWLMSPVGQTLAHIAADDAGAVLTTPDQQEYRAFSAESLTRRALGWPLPLSELRFWIVATPAGGDKESVATRDAAGRLSQLEQNGWTVRYTYPEPPDSSVLPKRLDMNRGEQRIRLVIDGWRREEAPLSMLAAFPAPAKLNLMLRVTGRRADGYHLLQTVFRFLDHGDVVRLRVRADGAIVRLRPLPGVAEADDLTVRAAKALQEATGVSMGAEIELEKRLPLGGGIGGGSSDAATVLLALNLLWHTGCSRKRLQELALPLGADVPVFVYGQSAFAEGVGEQLTPMRLPPAWYLVLVPPVAVSTATVFQHPELKRDSEKVKIQGFSALRGNDLEPVVCREYPEVARHLAWLKQFGDAQMTGSGACVFVAFPDEASARKAMAACPSDMRGFVARGLDWHPLHGLAEDFDG